MPPSPIGRVEAARQAVFLLQAFGDAEHAAEIADVLAEDQHVGIAPQHHVHGGIERLDHVHRGHDQTPISWRWSAQVPGHVLEHVLEHRRWRWASAVRQRADGFRLPCCAARTVSASFLVQRGVLVFATIRPARSDAVFSRSIGSPSGQVVGLVRRAIAARIVARGMAFGAIGVKFDQRRRRDWRARVPPPIASPHRPPGNRCRRRADPAMP